MRTRTALSFAFALIIGVSALAETPKSFQLPSWLPDTTAPGFELSQGEQHDYDQATFVDTTVKGDHVTIRGRYWHVALNTHKHYGKRWLTEGPAVWKKMESQLLGEGFREVYKHEDKYGVRTTFVRGSGEHATYVELNFIFNSDGAWLTIVEGAPNPLSVEAKPPAAKPESFSDSEPYPYIPLLPGTRLARTEHSQKPLGFVPAPHANQELVGTGYVDKMYDDPSHRISELAFREAYTSALQRAGWTITSNEGSGSLFARYDKNGRDLYLVISPRWHTVRVADVGSELKSTLTANCKASLYGINFDFDKATLRPGSEPVLMQVLDLLKSDAKLSLEIGGHTDNVGKPDYNMALSEKRAAAVREWLVSHGIAAARLTSHGYGETQPLVANNSEENKALNRRVELKKPGCK